MFHSYIECLQGDLTIKQDGLPRGKFIPCPLLYANRLGLEMIFSDRTSDFLKIINYLEEKFDIIIDSFLGLENVIDEFGWCLEGVNINILKIRFALIYFDQNARTFLESSKVDLKLIINDIEPGYHPLMEAVNQKNYEQAEFLLEMEADPNQGTEPWFPLMQADSHGDSRMIGLLENYGADLERNIRVYECWTNDVYGRTRKNNKKRYTGRK
jgi:hypothetical protein